MGACAISFLVVGAGFLASLSLAGGSDKIGWSSEDLRYTLSLVDGRPVLGISDYETGTSLKIEFEDLYLIEDEVEVKPIHNELSKNKTYWKGTYLNCSCSQESKGILHNFNLDNPKLTDILNKVKYVIEVQFSFEFPHRKNELLKVVVWIDDSNGNCYLSIVPNKWNHPVGAKLKVSSPSGVKTDGRTVRVVGEGSLPYLKSFTDPISREDGVHIEVEGNGEIEIGSLGIKKFKEGIVLPWREIMILVVATAAIVAAVLGAIILAKRKRREEEEEEEE